MNIERKISQTDFKSAGLGLSMDFAKFPREIFRGGPTDTVDLRPPDNYCNTVNNRPNNVAIWGLNVRVFGWIQRYHNSQDSPFFGVLREKTGLRYLFGFGQKSIDKS